MTTNFRTEGLSKEGIGGVEYMPKKALRTLHYNYGAGTLVGTYSLEAVIQAVIFACGVAKHPGHLDKAWKVFEQYMVRKGKMKFLPIIRRVFSKAAAPVWVQYRINCMKIRKSIVMRATGSSVQIKRTGDRDLVKA